MGLLFQQIGVRTVGFAGSLVILLALIAIALILIFHRSFQDLLGLLGRFRGEGEEDVGAGRDLAAQESEGEDVGEEPNESPRRSLKELMARRSEPAKEEEKLLTTRRRKRIELPLDLLDGTSKKPDSGNISRNSEIIERTFETFGIPVEMVDVAVGPTITQYAIRPAEGIKLSRIVALQNDLALALAAHPIRIEAPIPGKSLVGIEVPNKSIASVPLRTILEAAAFKKADTELTIGLGKDVSGTAWVAGLEKMPHLLVAGATGSGKSVCLNNIIVSLLYQHGPDTLKLILVDPKRVELPVYNGIPHLLVPPITKSEDAINALKWTVREMERRLDVLSGAKVRDIASYNRKHEEQLPYIVFMIDELADLMSISGREVEALVVRIAQMARAVGIHLVLATQRPSVDVITGLIKANIPTRIAFAVASQTDSRTILDYAGAEKLLGRGDMLLMAPHLSKARRLQGAYLSDREIKNVVNALKDEDVPDYNYDIVERQRGGSTVLDSESDDPLLEEAAEVVIAAGKASTSLLQRRLKIGYSRAARIMDLLEERGAIGPQDGAKPREVLIDSPSEVHGEGEDVGTGRLSAEARRAKEDDLSAQEDEESDEEEDVGTSRDPSEQESDEEETEDKLEDDSRE